MGSCKEKKQAWESYVCHKYDIGGSWQSLHGMDHDSEQHAELGGMVIGTDKTVDELTINFGTIGAAAYTFLMGVVAACP